MKRLGLFFLIVTTLCLSLAVPLASAHVLKTDGNIGAILHINPDDSPISGSPTSYVLYFDDLTGQFTLNHCDCSVTIKENGQIIATRILKTTSTLESDDMYTFPKPNVYTVEISGQPKPGYKFQSFVLNYLVRVEGDQVSTQPFPVLLWIGLGMMMVLILIGAYKSEHSDNIK